MNRVKAITIRTDIRVSDETEYKEFLKEKGFDKVEIFPTKANTCLSAYFENPAEFMRYKLRGIEQEFMGLRSNVYFYDLDEPFDDLHDIFDDNGDY